MKRFFIGLLILILLSFTAVVVHAEEETPPPDYRGTFDVMPGNESRLGINYRLGDKLLISGAYETDNQLDAVIKAGLHYQLFDGFGFGVGVRYDPATQVSVPYHGFEFTFPFGVNLAFTGSYDANGNGADWTRYETAMRIQMYESVYLFAGVRGDTGAVPNLPLKDQQPILFLKMDGDWQWGKFGLSIQPYLYVEGILYHDYTFKYQISDRVGLEMNYKDTFDRLPQYQVGLHWKF